MNQIFRILKILFFFIFRYICSRYYRAPELILNSDDYSTAVGFYLFFTLMNLSFLLFLFILVFISDIWSLGCVFAELLLGRPLFPGNTAIEQVF